MKMNLYCDSQYTLYHSARQFCNSNYYKYAFNFWALADCQGLRVISTWLRSQHNVITLPPNVTRLRNERINLLLASRLLDKTETPTFVCLAFRYIIY